MRNAQNILVRETKETRSHGRPRGDIEPAGEYTLFYVKAERESYQQLRRAKFVTDRRSYTILRGRWCDVIGLMPQQRIKLMI